MRIPFDSKVKPQKSAYLGNMTWPNSADQDHRLSLFLHNLFNRLCRHNYLNFGCFSACLIELSSQGCIFSLQFLPLKFFPFDNLLDGVFQLPNLLVFAISNGLKLHYRLLICFFLILLQVNGVTSHALPLHILQLFKLLLLFNDLLGL
jgi:hypothetical protein